MIKTGCRLRKSRLLLRAKVKGSHKVSLKLFIVAKSRTHANLLVLALDTPTRNTRGSSRATTLVDPTLPVKQGGSKDVFQNDSGDDDRLDSECSKE